MTDNFSAYLPEIYGEPGYYIDGLGNVHLRGLVRRNPDKTGQVIFELQEGFQPDHRTLFNGFESPNGPGRIDVLPDGKVLLSLDYPGRISLDGISFTTN